MRMASRAPIAVYIGAAFQLYVGINAREAHVGSSLVAAIMIERDSESELKFRNDGPEQGTITCITTTRDGSEIRITNLNLRKEQPLQARRAAALSST